MRFLVDAQLPARLARFLSDAGHDATHTSELPDGNRTTDDEINRLADADGRTVVTKDRDFRDSHLLRGSPRRLLVVSTATPPTTTCSPCSRPTSTRSRLAEARFVELASDRLIVHRSD